MILFFLIDIFAIYNKYDNVIIKLIWKIYYVTMKLIFLLFKKLFFQIS